MTEVARIIQRHRLGQKNGYNDVHALIKELTRLRRGLRNLKKGIEEHATDTVWCDKAETACDRIEWLLHPERSQSDASAKPK